MFSKNRFLIAVGFFVLFIFLSVTVVEASSTMWTKTFGGANFDYAVSLVETSDEGYVILYDVPLLDSIGKTTCSILFSLLIICSQSKN